MRTQLLKLRQTLAFTLALASVGLASSGQTTPNAQAAPKPTPKPLSTVSFYIYLHSMADRLDCHYTVETRLYSVDTPKKMIFDTGDDVYFTEDPSVRTIPAFVMQLRKEAKGLVVLQDKANPKIIHLIDAQLYNNANYPINQKVSLSYSGLVERLPDAIGKKIEAPLMAQRAFLVGDSAMDAITKVKLLVKDRPIRSVLTDPVSLKHYNCFIWTAETAPVTWTVESFPVEEKTRTEVNYLGPWR